MKKILPYNKTPLILMYHYTAFPTGIIQSNTEFDITPWICDKFINCYFDLEDSIHKFDFVTHDGWQTDNGVLFIDGIYVGQDLLDYLGWDLTSVIKTFINNEYYIQGEYNEEFIPGKDAYQKRYMSHDFLLIGYDDEKKVFISVGYLKDKFFQQYEISYENMKQSILTLKSQKITLNFIKYNKEAVFTQNLNQTLVDLKGYFGSYYEDRSGRVYGIHAIESLGKYFYVCAKERGEFDIRYARGLMEHKYCMKLRAEYFFGRGNKIVSYFDEIYKESKIIHMLGLKMLTTSNFNKIDSVCDKIKLMNQLEYEYIPLLISEIEKRQISI